MTVKRGKRFAMCAILAWAVSSAGQAIAQEREDRGHRLSAAQAVQAAEQLHRFGAEQGDAVALVAAARLLIASGFSVDDGALGELAPWELLRAAALVARPGSREELVIADTFAVARGVLQGASRQEGRLAPGESHTYTYTYADREIANVAVRLKEGRGANLNIRVVDGASQLVARDERDTHGVVGRLAYAEWVPIKCADFSIEVTNNGDADAVFLLVSSPSLSGSCAD